MDLSGQPGVAIESGRVVRPGGSRAVFREMLFRRLANIEDAIRRAQTIGGGVIIW